jgi:hypothetical protein
MGQDGETINTELNDDLYYLMDNINERLCLLNYQKELCA